MTIQFFEIHPTDTLFFRDGRPFNQDETITLAGVKSIFPPSPATIAGAIMVAYAKALGWNGSSPWSKPTEDKLNNKGKPLIFSGVFLRKDGEILFPAPQHLIELHSNDKKSQKIDDKTPSQDKKIKKRKFNELHELAFLTPSTETYNTDIGKVHLPEVKNKPNQTVVKPLEGYWITKVGLEQCLKLENPSKDTLYHQSELWDIEPKTGIERNQETHATKQGMLYTSSHIRLCKDVSIIIGVEGLPSEISIDNELIILGGEARTASLNLTKDINLNTLTTQATSNLIYIASPTPIADPQAIPNVKTACMPRQMRIGGWNSLKFKPLPLIPFLAPGTVLYMENPIDKDWAKGLAPKEFTQINTVYGHHFFGEYNNDNTK